MPETFPPISLRGRSRPKSFVWNKFRPGILVVRFKVSMPTPYFVAQYHISTITIPMSKMRIASKKLQDIGPRVTWKVEVSIRHREADQVAKEGIVGPSGNIKEKGKGKEVPRMPRKSPRKAANIPPSDSEEEKEEVDEAPPLCVECLRKKIACVPQPSKKWSCMGCYKSKIRCEFLDKTAWAVLEGSKKMAESIRELAGMEKRSEYFRLELKWYELQRFSFNLQRTGELDAAAADFRLLQMLNLKGQGLDILEDLEERFRTECLNIEIRVRECVDTMEKSMDEIWCEAGFRLPSGEPADSPTPSGKRKVNDEEEDETEEQIEERAVRTKRRKIFSDDE
ncbi:hypothetical protein M422DRAFT_276105 [Sphaerobolus stellatus SS14]|uniref:Zn(2)-C6 fungal-type domain-containing protein n=1 Tax=Sphaerobolus stellatus (strain SS14) TaxID=990650 RepID=A0A0C9TN96_SPHS4|nr:hypothetical protein M422DRAFT_276105 [Sphaerobolus stellatus SS14]